jgi:Holliday junction DNA helicase RuvA
MIAYLRGKLHSKTNTSMIIDVQGVGYEVFTPTSFRQNSILGDELEVQVTTVVREDAFLLYGFESTSQKEAFTTLCSVNKVGPKLAMTILSHLELNQLAIAIEQKDSVTLSSVPGIGKKTAERMCLELKGKLNVGLEIDILGMIKPKVVHRTEDPLQLALAQLDYRKSEINAVLNSDSVPSIGSASLQERLGAALRFLATQQ